MTRPDSSSQPMSAEPARRPMLRRELRFPETAAVSIGVMAPTLAMSVTGVAAASTLGRAAPLAFAFAALGVGFVAYGFVRLAGEFSHAGSVYAFVGNTLGPRPGFLAGWALLGTYLVFPPVSIMGVAIFGRAFLDTTGLARDATGIRSRSPPGWSSGFSRPGECGLRPGRSSRSRSCRSASFSCSWE